MNGSELLLSWVDVARRLWKVSQPCEGGTNPEVPPKGLVYTQTFWDSLFVGVAPGVDHDDVLAWLSGIFGPRWQRDEHGWSILLEAHGEALSRLPVALKELDEEDVAEWCNTPFQPRFSPPRTVHFSRTPTPEPDPFPLDQPPVLAFHSFKGGVGRTLCALATTLAYTGHKKKVLLVDADFEAPGISFLFEERKPDPDFALADLLTMLHADPDPDGKDALVTAIKGVSNQCLDNVFVLPCFRNLKESVSLEIRPEHLVASTAHHPFFLGDILSRLGKALRVDLVIVDLRAGLSELSAPLIFDPRIKRILVANASGQSIKGTRFIIQEIGDTLKTNGWSVNNLPALILNQLPSVMMPKKGEPGNERFNAMVESIDEALVRAFPQREMSVAEKSELILPTTAEEGISKVTISYNEPLAMLSDTWDDALETIRQSVIPEKIWDTLQLWLPATGEPVPKAKVWGIKLGGDKTNEAISNNWVLSVLSDLRARIQTRDVVRFIGLAARKSVGNTKTGDRILAPAAMRDAIAECSQKKIDEISEENAPLKDIFDKIKGKNSSPTHLSSPCTYKKLASLSLTEGQIELLEENGIIFFDNSEKKYHFPEIFRYGLSVDRVAGARPKVLSLIRQTRNQGRF